MFYDEMPKGISDCGIGRILQIGSWLWAVALGSWRLCPLLLNISALWLLSCCGESAIWNHWVSTSKSFKWYDFVVGWSWLYSLSELSLFCTYWSNILRERNANAWLVANRLQSGVVVKRSWCWIVSDVLFAVISNWKFRSISFVWTWAILSKLSMPIVFFRSWHFRCVTQERLPFRFSNRGIWILLQIPNMINIISSWPIIDCIGKDRWPISLKFNRNRLMSSTNRSCNLVFLRSRTHILIYFGIYVAVSLLPLTNMILWATWKLWRIIILTWSWSNSRCIWSSRLWHRESGVDRSLLYATSWSWPSSTFQPPSSIASSWEQSGFRILSVMWSFVSIKNWVLSIWNIALLSSIADNSTFRSDMRNRVVLRRSRSLSIPTLNLMSAFFNEIQLLALPAFFNDMRIQQLDVICALSFEWQRLQVLG